jgi:hypothetical protein
MQTARKRLHVPGITLQLLLGAGSVHPDAAAYRRTRITREWPCGCRASYVFDRFEDTEWEPCAVHAPADD